MPTTETARSGVDIVEPGEGASVKSLKGLVFDTKRVWTL